MSTESEREVKDLRQRLAQVEAQLNPPLPWTDKASYVEFMHKHVHPKTYGPPQELRGCRDFDEKPYTVVNPPPMVTETLVTRELPADWLRGWSE